MRASSCAVCKRDLTTVACVINNFATCRRKRSRRVSTGRSVGCVAGDLASGFCVLARKSESESASESESESESPSEQEILVLFGCCCGLAPLHNGARDE